MIFLVCSQIICIITVNTHDRKTHDNMSSIFLILDLDSNSESVFTLVRHSQARHPMKFSISAGTEISFLGDRFVHTYLTHQFSFPETRDTPTELTLNARARQFSCFMLMIGTIGGVDTFEPKYAIIVKNKDDLKLPLILEQVRR